MLQLAAPNSPGTPANKPASPSPAALAARAGKRQREAAKVAMVATLGAVTVTGLMLMRHHHGFDKSAVKATHIATGLALVGACWWHNSLYGPRRSPQA
jgi:hypothetical protein